MNVAESLNTKGATPETVLQVMAHTVFEASGGRSEAEMEAELSRAFGDAKVAEAKERLQSNPDVINEVALLWIGSIAEDKKNEPLLASAIAVADKQMPFLEIGALTLIALYGLYLTGPDKPTKITRTIKQNADGSFEEALTTDFADFSMPLRGLLGLLSAKGVTSPEENSPEA